MTAADQTPATDSERDERLRTLAALLLRHGHVDWDAHDARTVANAVMEGWAAPLLAEQAATIERVAAVHVRRVWDYDRDPVTRFKNQQFLDQCDHCRVNWPCRTATALGSQRTEAQG